MDDPITNGADDGSVRPPRGFAAGTPLAGTGAPPDRSGDEADPTETNPRPETDSEPPAPLNEGPEPDQFRVPSVAGARKVVADTGRPRPLGRGQGVVACLSRGHVVIFHVDGRGDRLVIRPIVEREITADVEERAAPDVLIETFGEALEELPRSCRSLHVILEEPLLHERLLHLPQAKDRHLRALVDAAGRSLGADKASYKIRGRSFQDGREGIAVDAGFCVGRQLDDLEQAANARGCWIKRITSRPAGGLSHLELFASADVRGGRFLLLEIVGDYVRLSLVEDEWVVFFRIVDIGGAVRPEDIAGRCVTEVQRTNIFMGSRFRERPTDKVVVVGVPGRVLETVVSRVGVQFNLAPIHVAPRIEISGEMGPRAESWIHDAAASVVAPHLERSGALTVTAPCRDQRRRAFMLVPTVIFLALGLVAATWAYDRGARLDARDREASLKAVANELLRIPPAAARYPDVQAVRANFKRQVDDLAAALGRRDPVERAVRDLLARLPKEAVVLRLDYQAVKPPSQDPDPVRVDPGPPVPTVVIEGRLLVAMVNAPQLMKKIVAGLNRSPYVARIRDDSGAYDPFEAPDGDPMAAQYPLALSIELRRDT